MGDILALLGSGAVGSIIGGVFAFLNRKEAAKAKVIENEHEQKRWEHNLKEREADLKIVQAEAGGRFQVAQAEAEGVAEAARFTALTEAHKGDAVGSDEIKAAGKLGWLFVLVSAFAKIIRPAMTVALVGAALYVNWLLIEKLGFVWGDLTTDQQISTGMQAFSWVTAQGSVVISYWFVSRGNSGKN